MNRYLSKCRKSSPSSYLHPMRLLLFLFLLLSTPQTFAQNKSLEIPTKTLSVGKLFAQIEHSTGFLLVYSDKDVDVNAKITFAQTKGNLKYFLSHLASELHLNYDITQNKYVVFRKKAVETHQQSTKGSKLTGHITDEKGEPLIGATIIQKGTQNKTITDMDGNFEIDAPKGSTLLVSYIGAKDKEIKASESMQITMTDDIEALDEVVVIGYGTVKKADLAGSIAVLDSKSYRDQPIVNATDALQGRVAGVSVTNSGAPGGTIKVRVRGASSINRSNDPLYVVDGIVRESGVAGLDPEDIQSMQVLKDASATAIYGSRGSNGVILITTKTGKANQQLITFDAKLGVSNVAKRYDTLSPYEFAVAYNEAHPNTFDSNQLSSFQNGTTGTDWQDAVFKTGITQDYKVALSNGNDKTQYYVSANYIGQTGTVIENNYNRYQFRANMTSDVSKWLSLTTDINFSHSADKSHNFTASKNNVLWAMLNYSPVTDIYDANGGYNPDRYCAITEYNPVATLKESRSQNRRDILNARVDLKFTILPNLTFTSTNGVDYNDYKYYYFNSKKISVNINNGMSNADTQRMALQTTNNLTYHGQWGLHSLTATGVFESSFSKTRFMKISGDNLLTESVGWWNSTLAKSRQDNNSYSSWSLLSYVSRLMYNYNDRYLVTGTFRADGSSKFSNQKWGYFPSLALAWQLGNENFMQHQNVIQNAKLRLSYGIVGSQAIDPYETLGLMSQTTIAFGGDSKYTGYWTGTNVPTPDLTWEKTHQFNAGLDFGILDSRIRFTFDYFVKFTKDGLLRKNMPNYDGGGSYWVNACEVTNRGLDFTIDADILRSKDFSWNSAFTGTFLKNKVTSLDNIPFIAGNTPAYGLVGAVSRVKVGYPIGSFFLYDWTGIDANGHDTYADYDNSGTLSEGDKIVTGKATPDFSFGWNNIVTWRNWTLSAFFTGAIGVQRLNLIRYTAASFNGNSKFITLRDAYYNSFGKSANPIYPSVTVTDNDYEAASTKWLENADYLRLDNLSLSYALPKKVLRFADATLSLSVQNLFTITKYKGMDPAGVSFMSSELGSTDLNDGIDMGAYPLSRTVTFGLKVNF